MSLNNFIPQLWGDSLLTALRKNLVYGGPLINRDWEGQIKQMGDTVKINMIGDITISNYSKDTDLASPLALRISQRLRACKVGILAIVGDGDIANHIDLDRIAHLLDLAFPVSVDQWTAVDQIFPQCREQ